MTQTKRGDKGFSLTETLVALALVALLGAIIAGGLPAVIGSYQDVMRKEHADVLCSTVTNRVIAELRGATEFDVTTESFVSHSGTRLDGQRISITTDVEDYEGYATITYYGITTDSQGTQTLTALTEEDGFEPAYLLPVSTYTNDLTAELTYEATTTSVKLTVDIQYVDGESTTTYATSDTTIAFGSSS